MKGLFKYTVLIMLFSFSGCYSDDSDVSIHSLDAAHRTSHLTDLIKSVTLHHSSFDDVVDGSSCFSLKFPYELKVNSELMSISNMDDISVLSEKDVIEIQYPVSVIFFDYTSHQVNSASDLRNLQLQCESTFDIKPNSCIEFDYPITVKDFNDFTSSFSTHHFTNNEAFFLYLEHLHDSDMFEIEYPITLNDTPSTSIEISSNLELINALDNPKDCQ